MNQKVVYQFEHIKNGIYQSGYESLEIVDGQAEIDPNNAALVHLAEKWLGGKKVEAGVAVRVAEETRPTGKSTEPTTKKGSDK